MAAESSPFDTNKYREEKTETHTTYIGYEFGSAGIDHPSVGHRYQNGSYIFDVNGGYRYGKAIDSVWHLGKVGVNIYKSIHSTNKGQFYSGIGVDLLGAHGKSHYGSRSRDYALHPSASIGHDFNLDESKNIFFELTYKPYSLGKHENTSIHSLGCRMGIGF